MLRRPLALVAAAALVSVPLALPASADHTDPTTVLSPLVPQSITGTIAEGEGEWEFVANLGPMQGTDLEFFSRKGVTYVSGGTLGQAPAGVPAFVGQRILQLTDDQGVPVTPTVVADHGSSRCDANSSATGLQHDVQAVPRVETELLVDTTDAVGRCHDTPGGGLELLDVSGLGEEGFEVREIGLIRFNGLSHTVTADVTIPGILYNNGADFGTGSGEAALGQAWTDVVDVRSCMGLIGKTLDEKRAACRPVVTRFPYDYEWTSKALPGGGFAEPASCHDVTAAPGRLYCAALNATLVLDVSGVLGPDGKVQGTPLPCVVGDGTRTGAKVTDCALKAAGSTSANPTAAEAVKAYADLGSPKATGIKFLGTVNHPGRNCGSPDTTNCNTNTAVRSDEGVAVSHEADPTPDGDFMFVTDERGGGVLPPGATCAPGLDNPVGNGGLHVFDIRDPSNIVPAPGANGGNAVYIGTSPTPAPTFCTIHVIEQIPGEARLIAAYYDGGTKIVDYSVAEDGTWSFEEVAAYRLPGANTWASEVFATVDNPDGTRTYHFVSTSFALGLGTARGMDVFTWTGQPNLLAAPQAPAAPPAAGPPPAAPAPPTAPGTGALPATGPDRALLLLASVLLPSALAVRWWRRRLGPSPLA